MNTGHNHHQGDFHTEDIQDAECQDAEIIDETHDQKMVAEAYAVAKEITDDVKKAEALLYLINEAE